MTRHIPKKTATPHKGKSGKGNKRAPNNLSQNACPVVSDRPTKGRMN